MGAHMTGADAARMAGPAYADGTSGFAQGSPTSEAAVKGQDRRGQAGKRQGLVISTLGVFKGQGMTVPEFRDLFDQWHHGQASAAFSNAHKAGRIARLSEVRGRASVYVLPEHVNGRATEVHGSRHHQAAELAATIAYVRDLAEAGVEEVDRTTDLMHPSWRIGYSDAMHVILGALDGERE